MADEPLQLFDHTWIRDHKKKQSKMHSFNGRPIPGWLGGSIHLPSLIPAAAAAVIIGVPVRLIAGLILTPNALVGLLLWLVCLAAGFVLGYTSRRRINVLDWLAVQRDWRKQPRRIRSEWAGKADPDRVRASVILWRPIDSGWTARAGVYRTHLAAIHEEQTAKASDPAPPPAGGAATPAAVSDTPPVPQSAHH